MIVIKVCVVLKIFYSVEVFGVDLNLLENFSDRWEEGGLLNNYITIRKGSLLLRCSFQNGI